MSYQTFKLILLDRVIAVDVRRCRHCFQVNVKPSGSENSSTHACPSRRWHACRQLSWQREFVCSVPSMKSCACSSVIRTFLDRNAAATSFASSLSRDETESELRVMHYNLGVSVMRGKTRYKTKAHTESQRRIPAVMVAVEGLKDLVERVNCRRDAATPLPYLRSPWPPFWLAPSTGASSCETA